MANSFVRYTGNGSTTAYSIPFSYRLASDLTVTIAGSSTTAFSLNSAGTTLTFDSAPANSVAIEIRRATSQGTKLVDYSSGSVLTETDLDTDSEQAFFMGQEAIDQANDVISIDNADFQWTAGSKRIKNISDPTAAQDAVTKNYLENTYLTSSTITGINSLSAVSTQIGLLGTSDAVSDMNTLGTSDIVTDMNVLGTSANVTAMGLLGTAAVVEDMGILGTTANVTNMATVSSNISGVNSFAERYRVGSSDPSSSLDAGDLAYNTSSNVLKFYNGSAWSEITASADVKVGVSSNDSTPGYLNGKLVAGTGISFTENNDGSNETLTITNTADDPVAMAIALG